ncbi:carboxypeptidase-like regulatory domain-containing protein [Mucilaginibacter dorajii]|uniref:Plug domain-containing protein n=1 Tax=Mucilaginibacter dorajii TaxID=692994 RepID=A0ABP7P9H4_9SPHI|nr:carboxypeptidase-like regulatory domain-containing protein [Mucilaginibacter dorajii]MCS3735223.1 hypothetical protein [Mucilaginibacter dorajii]
MKLTWTFVFIVLLLAPLNSFAQTDTSFLKRTVTALDRYTDVNPVEKVHLHLNKINYTPGDTIWFKAYTVAGQSHGLSAISNILHVELLTDKDSMVSKIAIPLSSGIGWGDFAIPVLLKTSNYHVRAYTSWMRNFAPDYFFDQSILISDIQPLVQVKKEKAAADPDVQFFPEGGSLINGLRTKVAIKAINSHGMGEDVNGTIVDNDGTEVAVFSTQHLGMGVFALIPQPGKTYKAKINRKDGRQFTVNLPKAQDDGFAIAVNNSAADTISVRVASSPKLFEVKKGAKYYMVAQTGGEVYFAAGFTLSAQSFITKIDKKRFPTGIVQFTLFAENGEPLNQRIAFIQHNDELKLSIESSKATYASREMVNMNLKATSADSKPVAGSFSVSVINQDFVDANPTAENGILCNLLLTSDIKGYIEQPNYYFTNTNDKTSADLDLLMLTQGYHRFEWKQVLNNIYPELNYDPEAVLSVSGFVKTFGGKPVPNGKIMIYNTKGGWFKLDTTSSENGRFTFKGLITDPDTTLKYVIQARTAADKKKLDISLDTAVAFKSWKNISFNQLENDTMGTPYQKQIKQQMKLKLDRRLISLKEVVIKESKAPLSGNVFPDQTVMIPKEPNGQTLSQYLSTRLRGVIFKNGLPYSTRANRVMNIILDGMVIDPLYFQSLNLTEIEGVEILRTTGQRDFATGLGNVLVLTHRKYNGKAPLQFTPDVITYRSNGLYKSRVFYAPKYDAGKENVQTLDLRTAIYWKPDIVTDKDGNATLSFYNADTKGTYRIVIEGVDVSGNLGRQVYTYMVQ